MPEVVKISFEVTVVTSKADEMAEAIKNQLTAAKSQGKILYAQWSLRNTIEDQSGSI